MPGKPRVHELASELGVSSKQVLTALEGLGAFVKSAASTVEPAAARRVREHFAAQPRRPIAELDSRRTPHQGPATRRPPHPASPPPPSAPRSRLSADDAALMRAERALGAEPGSTRRDAPDGAAAIAEAERLFGLQAGDLSRRTPSSGRSNRSSGGRSRPIGRARPPVADRGTPRPSTGALAEAIGQQWRLRPDAARELSQAWLPALLAAEGDIDKLRGFWRAGFGRDHATLVDRCLTEGIGPDQLSLRLDGRRVGEHILGGGAIRLIAIRLRDGEKH